MDSALPPSPAPGRRASFRDPDRLHAALTRYRFFAYLTGVLLGFMTVVGLPYHYAFGGEAAWYSWGWMLHGWVYIGYVAVALDLVFRLRWGLLRALGVVLAGTVPFMSFVAERAVSKAIAAEIVDLRNTQGAGESLSNPR